MSDQIKKGRLSEGHLIAVSMWAIGHYLGMGVANAYFSYFLTNIVLMPAEDMGTLMFICRILPVFLVPVLSALFQNHALPYGKKFGKYRTYIFTFVPMVALMCVLTFIPMPGLSRWSMFVYYFLTYFLFSTLYGFPQTCFQTMMSRVGNAYDTPRVTGHRAIFSSCAAVLYSASCLPLVNALGGGDMGKGYTLCIVVYQIIYIVCCGISCIAYKNGDYYPGDQEVRNQQTKLSLAQQWSAFKCRPFQVAFWGDLFKNIGYFFFTGATTYYFTSVVGDLNAVTLYLTVLNLSGILAAFIIGPLSQKIGLRNSYLCCYGGMAGGLILAFFFGKSLIGFYIFTIIFRVAYGFSYSIGLLSYSQAADIHYLKTGEDTLSWMMTMYGLPLQLGSALTAGVVGWVLGAAGYDGAAAVQSDNVVLWIRLMTTLIPGLFCVVAYLLWQFLWPIKSRKEQDELEAKVAALKG